MRRKICFIVGTRPQLIKINALLSSNMMEKWEITVIDTGQHYDTNLYQKVIDDCSNIFRLSITYIRMEWIPNNNLANYQVLKKLVRDLFSPPEIIVIVGDTNSTLLGSLVAIQLGIDLVHLEAGLRCGDTSMPEERIRKIVDSMSDYLIAPDKNAVENLFRESVPGQVLRCHDPLIESFKLRLGSHNFLSSESRGRKFKPKKAILVTIHRKSAKDQLTPYIKFLNATSQLGHEVVWPIHSAMKTYVNCCDLELDPAIKLVDPLSSNEFIHSLNDSDLVITDSGGVQRECFLMGIFCIVLRPSTEWNYTIDMGGARLVDVQSENFEFDPELLNNKYSESARLYAAELLRARPIEEFWNIMKKLA